METVFSAPRWMQIVFPWALGKEVIAEEIKTISNLLSCLKIVLGTSEDQRTAGLGKQWPPRVEITPLLESGIVCIQKMQETKVYLRKIFMSSCSCFGNWITQYFLQEERNRSKTKQNFPQNIFTVYLRTKLIRPTQPSMSSKVRKKILFNILTESRRPSL